MANGNNVTLVGNITRDPELRFTATGQATATFGLAVNRRWQNRQTNDWEEATSFFDVVCWREMAENASESLSRGARVIVTGDPLSKLSYRFQLDFVKRPYLMDASLTWKFSRRNDPLAAGMRS